MRRALCGMRFKRCLPAALCCNRRCWGLAAIRRHIKNRRVATPDLITHHSFLIPLLSY